MMRQHAGPLVRRGQRDDGADRALEAAAEADAGDAPCRRRTRAVDACAIGEQGDADADEQRDGADQTSPCAAARCRSSSTVTAPLAARTNSASPPSTNEFEPTSEPDQASGRASRRNRRAPTPRPAPATASSERARVPPAAARTAGSQRGERAGPGRRGLGHQQRRRRPAATKIAEQHAGRPGASGPGRNCTSSPDADRSRSPVPVIGATALAIVPLALVEVEHAGARRAPTAAPVDRPWTTRASSSSRHAGGGREDQHRGGLHGDRGQQHRAAADVVGQRADGQQRREHGERVDAEDDRRGDRREAPLGLVERVERGRRAGAGQEEHHDRRLQVEAPPVGRRRRARCRDRGDRASVESSLSWSLPLVRTIE